MAWFNADDHMHSHPKPRKAGLAAMGLWVLCGTHATAGKTNGFVPQWYIDSWGEEGRELASVLVETRFWDEADGGYQFRSWDEYQRTKEQVERDQERNRERQRNWRERQRNKRDEQG